MLALALPHHGLKTGGAQAHELIEVAEDYRALPPELAYDDAISEAARLYDFDPALIRGVIQVESSFNPSAVSSSGAIGPMQLMPGLAQALDVSDPFNPRENVLAGSRYLRDLLDLHHGNIDLALASYNAGPGAVARFEGKRSPV